MTLVESQRSKYPKEVTRAAAAKSGLEAAVDGRTD